MTKRLFLLITVIFSLIVVSCDKVYINGDLDGMWQLQKVEGIESIEYPKGIYYSFQRHMVQVGKYYSEGIPLRFIGNLDYHGDTITISGLRKFLEEEKTCTPQELEMFYLYNENVIFRIEKLSDEVLVLKGNDRLYTLHKW